MVSLTGKRPTHCGVGALPLRDIKICKAQEGEYSLEKGRRIRYKQY